jgi:hypothetical protein
LVGWFESDGNRITARGGPGIDSLIGADVINSPHWTIERLKRLFTVDEWHRHTYELIEVPPLEPEVTK